MSSMPNDLSKLIFYVADYYKESLPEIVLNFWLNGLAKFPFEDIKAAFENWMMTSDRMPKISNIVKTLEGSIEDRALAALLKVENAMEMHGSYATVVFDDPVIHATLQSLGGWINACRQTEYEFTWWKKEFRERYQHFEQYGLAPDVSVRLSGIFDETNLPLGGTPQKPKVVGDYEKAIGWVSKMEKAMSPALRIRELAQKSLKTMDGI